MGGCRKGNPPLSARYLTSGFFAKISMPLGMNWNASLSPGTAPRRASTSLGRMIPAELPILVILRVMFIRASIRTWECMASQQRKLVHCHSNSNLMAREGLRVRMDDFVFQGIAEIELPFIHNGLREALSWKP